MTDPGADPISADPTSTAPISSAPASPPTVVRIPRMVLVGALFGLLCAVPLGAAAPLAFGWVLALPVLAVAYVLRVRTVVGPAELVAVQPFSTTRIGWDEVRGIRFPRDERTRLGGWARAVLDDGSEVRLPGVMFNHLPALATASGGRVPDPYAAIVQDTAGQLASDTPAPRDGG